jgi:hypothetical protein
VGVKVGAAEGCELVGATDGTEEGVEDAGEELGAELDGESVGVDVGSLVGAFVPVGDSVGAVENGSVGELVPHSKAWSTNLRIPKYEDFCVTDPPWPWPITGTPSSEAHVMLTNVSEMPLYLGELVPCV